jgi:transposase
VAFHVEPSDLIDAEWVFIAPLIPPGRRGGRKRSVDVSKVLNAIFYVLATGCQWNAVPKDLPPKSTAHVLPTSIGEHRRPNTLTEAASGVLPRE